MTVEREIEGGQGETLAFFESPPSAGREYLSTVVAFANGIGGTILFGVSHDGKVAGITEREVRSEIDALGEAVSDVRPENLSIDIGLSAAYGKTIIVLDIEKGNRKPYTARMGGKDVVFVRKGTETVEADGSAVERLTSGLAFDTGTYVSAEWVAYTDESAKPGPMGAIPSNKAPIDSDLAGGTDEGCAPTNAQALVGANPFPHAFIRCNRYAGDFGEPVETIDFKGRLEAQLSSATAYVLMHFGDRLDRESVWEALGNAIVHRDYSIPEPILVKMHQKLLSIMSPGSSVGRVGLLAKGRSYPRNPLLQDELIRFGILSGRGAGLAGILERNPGTEISETLQSFTVEIPAQKPQPAKLSRNEQAILAELSDDGTLSAREVSERTDIPFGTVRRLMNDLRLNGLISREGSKKTGVWVLSE